MSRTRIYLVGSHPRSDVWLNHESVSKRHAEVLRLPDGRLYVTDCHSTSGTYLVYGDAEQRFRQEFLPEAARIRFGARLMTTSELQRACRPFRSWTRWRFRLTR